MRTGGQAVTRPWLEPEKYIDGFAPRRGDLIEVRLPRKDFRNRVRASVQIIVTSLEPLRAEPVALVRSWGSGFSFGMHRRKLCVKQSLADVFPGLTAEQFKKKYGVDPSKLKFQDPKAILLSQPIKRLGRKLK